VLLEKLEELEQENDRLQAALREMDAAREDLDKKLNISQEMLVNEQRENEKLNEMLR
jgi:prefoldin subunit 5